MIKKIKIINLLKQYGYTVAYASYYVSEEIKNFNGAIKEDNTNRFTIYTASKHIVGRLYNVFKSTDELTHEQLKIIINFFEEYNIPHHQDVSTSLRELL